MYMRMFVCVLDIGVVLYDLMYLVRVKSDLVAFILRGEGMFYKTAT